MKLFHIIEVDSTNQYAKEHLNNFEDLTTIYADNQTSGRGRLDRKWNFTGKNNIYASIILKPSNKMQKVYSNLTQLLSLILALVFEEYGIEPKIKWPNDVRINCKKISGILAESVIEKNILKGIILGFGVNLNVEKSTLDNINQPATALNIETGKFIDKEIFLKKVLDKFCLLYNRFIEEGFLLIREDYKKRAEFLNKRTSVKVLDKIYEGIVTDITEDGALKLIDDNNKEHILYIGDIL